MSIAHPLVELARKTIEVYIREGRVIEPPEELTPEMRERAAVFVSLHDKQGNLRGCIGNTEPTQPDVAHEIIRYAIAAATEDPRFSPVRPEELDELEVKVDVLSPPEPVENLDELDPKRYGVIVQSQRNPLRRGLLLPDLPGIDTVEQQVEYTRRNKAHITDDEEPVQLYRFEVKRYT